MWGETSNITRQLALRRDPIYSSDRGHLQRYSQSRRSHGSQLFHDLTDTIPSFHHSNPEAINGGTASGGHSYQQLFWERPVTKEPMAL